jgi:hypothetical protein
MVLCEDGYREKGEAPCVSTGVNVLEAGLR